MTNGEGRLRRLLFEAIRELSYVQSVENCNSGLCATSLGEDLVERGIKELGVKDLSDELEAALAAPVQAEVGAGERGTIQWWIARCYEAENKLEALLAARPAGKVDKRGPAPSETAQKDIRG